MQSSLAVASRPVSLRISRNLAAVVLFALFGLTVSLAVITHVPAEDVAAILTYVE